MPAIKVAEFAFPRLEAPDLDQMEEFLTHFGLIRAERTPDALYMRGADDHHHLHVTHKGGTKFVGFAYHASEDDLERAREAASAIAAATLGRDPGAVAIAASMSHYVGIAADVVVKLVDVAGHNRLDLEIVLASHLPSGLGAPLLGDPVYGEGKGVQRTMLHAAALTVPREGKAPIAATAPLPDDFAALGFSDG